MRIDRPDEPAFAGGATFNKVPLALDPAELAHADVAIVGAPTDDLVTNRPGARFGPRAIRTAYDGGGARMYNLDAGLDVFDALSVVDHGDVEATPGDAATTLERLRATVEQVVDSGCVPIVLGGDHSIAYPDIAAVAASLEPGSLAVVQFDTHADTATENYGVRNSHGTPFRHLVDDGVIRGDRLIQVGLRGYWPFPDEWEWARAAGVRWHLMESVAQRGIDDVMNDVIEQLGDASHLFLSVDIDVLDPAFAPGTGTPEPGGMNTYDLLRAVRRLARERGLAGMEVVEVSPPYDHADITALAAHRVVLEALTGLALHRSGSEPAPERDSSG